MWMVTHSLLLTALLAVPFASVSAQTPTDDNIRKLDDEVQDVKTEALDIAAELNLLERQLLYPAATRVTVSLALGRGTDVELNAVEIRIDGDLTARHVYTAAEREALQKGGVQGLYTGNVPAGTHELGVRIIGRLTGGADFEEAGSHGFSKSVDPKSLDIRFDYAGREDDGIRIEDR